MAGYASKTTSEHFKIGNFIYTAIISLAIGFVTVFSGLSTQSSQMWRATWAANGYITWRIWKLSKILASKITKKQITTTAKGPRTTA